MRSTQAIIFDLDGTLVDSAPAIADVLNAMRSERGLPRLPAKDFYTWISRGASALIQASLEAEVEEIAVLLAEFRRRYLTSPGLAGKLFPAVQATLTELRKRGVKLAICSNKPLPLCQKIVQQLALDHCFVAVIGSRPGLPSKPSPEPLDLALSELQADPAEAIFVGDSSVDQKTAAARGVPFVFFAGGYGDGVDNRSALRSIATMDELLDVIA